MLHWSDWLQVARVIYCCLKRKWCLKGNNIFTRNRDFQRVKWTFYFSIILTWIAPEHYVTLELKNHNRFQLSFVLFVRSLQDGQNHLLAPFNYSGSRNFLIDSGTDEAKRRVIISNFYAWMLQKRQTFQVTLESGWNDIVCHLQDAFQLINHNL